MGLTVSIWAITIWMVVSLEVCQQVKDVNVSSISPMEVGKGTVLGMATAF